MFHNQPLPTIHSYESFTYCSRHSSAGCIIASQNPSMYLNITQHNAEEGVVLGFLSVFQLVRQSMEFFIATPLKGLNKCNVLTYHHRVFLHLHFFGWGASTNFGGLILHGPKDLSNMYTGNDDNLLFLNCRGKERKKSGKNNI